MHVPVRWAPHVSLLVQAICAEPRFCRLLTLANFFFPFAGDWSFLYDESYELSFSPSPSTTLLSLPLSHSLPIPDEQTDEEHHTVEKASCLSDLQSFLLAAAAPARVRVCSSSASTRQLPHTSSSLLPSGRGSSLLHDTESSLSPPRHTPTPRDQHTTRTYTHSQTHTTLHYPRTRAIPFGTGIWDWTGSAPKNTNLNTVQDPHLGAARPELAAASCVCLAAGHLAPH